MEIGKLGSNSFSQVLRKPHNRGRIPRGRYWRSLKRIATRSKSLAAPLHPFCAFSSTFNASPSSQFPRQPNNSPSLLPPWRRLCSIWSSSAWSARQPANSAIAFSHIIATWISSTRERNYRKRVVEDGRIGTQKRDRPSPASDNRAEQGSCWPPTSSYSAALLSPFLCAVVLGLSRLSQTE